MIKFIFFGTPEPAVTVLETLKTRGLIPSLIITAPDKPKGRGLLVQASPVATWAEKECIPVEKPTTLKDGVLTGKISSLAPDVALVFAYGKIIPEGILSAPTHGTLNIHPSLLPLYRGPCPVEGALLNGDSLTGVSLMKIDAEMDHGPILKQTTSHINEEETAPTLLNRLCIEGAELFSTTVEAYIADNVAEKEQDHTKATYTQKIKKSDGEVSLEDDSATLWNKYRAYTPWPGIYFFTERNTKRIRVSITKASYKDGVFTIEKVIPEGKKEMSYADFERGQK
jgi:methionyl-tRNA formyltransferase